MTYIPNGCFFINLKRKTAPKAPENFSRALRARAPISYIYKGGNRGLTPTLIFIKGFCNFCKKMHKPLGGKKKNGAEGTPKIFRARRRRARAY